MTTIVKGRGGSPQSNWSIKPHNTNNATILLQEAFIDANFAGRGWYDQTAIPITSSVPSGQFPGGYSSAAVANFAQGTTNPWGSGAMRHLFTATTTFYLSYWVQYSTNWIGSGVAYHPHEFTTLSNLDEQYDGGSDSYLTLYVENNYQNGGIPRMSAQDSKLVNIADGTPPNNLIGVTNDRSTCGCNGVVETLTTAGGDMVTTCYSQTPDSGFPPWYSAKQVDSPNETVYFQPNPGPGYKSNWNFVEAYFAMNSFTAGSPNQDGIMQYWFNGALAINRLDIMFQASASVFTNQLLFAPYIGVGSPINQTAYYTGITVATGRV